MAYFVDSLCCNYVDYMECNFNGKLVLHYIGYAEFNMSMLIKVFILSYFINQSLKMNIAITVQNIRFNKLFTFMYLLFSSMGSIPLDNQKFFYLCFSLCVLQVCFETLLTYLISSLKAQGKGNYIQ